MNAQVSEAATARVEGFMAAANGFARDASKPADWLCGFDGYAVGMAAEAERQERESAERAAYVASPAYRATVAKTKAKARARARSSTPRSLDGHGSPWARRADR